MAQGAPLAWLCMLSLDGVVDLNYPWDCLLLEAGFLGLFLPATLPLAAGSLAATSAPLPGVAWAFRWLLFRVLFGFGKLVRTQSTPPPSTHGTPGRLALGRQRASRGAVPQRESA